MHRIVAFTALLLGVAFWGLGSPATAGDYYSGYSGRDNGYYGGGYHRSSSYDGGYSRSSYYDNGYSRSSYYDNGYGHRYSGGNSSSNCCYRKITKYVPVGEGYGGGYRSSYYDGGYRSSSYDRGYSSRPYYRSSYYDGGYARPRYNESGYSRPSYYESSSYNRPRYYDSGYSSRYYGGGYSYRPRHYDSSYSYSARTYDSSYGTTSYASGPRLYSGYYNGYPMSRPIAIRAKSKSTTGEAAGFRQKALLRLKRVSRRNK